MSKAIGGDIPALLGGQEDYETMLKRIGAKYLKNSQGQPVCHFDQLVGGEDYFVGPSGYPVTRPAAWSFKETEIRNIVARVLSPKGMSTGFLVRKDESAWFLLTANRYDADPKVKFPWSDSIFQARVVFTKDNNRPDYRDLARLSLLSVPIPNRPWYSVLENSQDIEDIEVGMQLRVIGFDTSKGGTCTSVALTEGTGSTKSATTDIIVNAADSGAPAVNQWGQLVGITVTRCGNKQFHANVVAIHIVEMFLCFWDEVKYVQAQQRKRKPQQEIKEIEASQIPTKLIELAGYWKEALEEEALEEAREKEAFAEEAREKEALEAALKEEEEALQKEALQKGVFEELPSEKEGEALEEALEKARENGKALEKAQGDLEKALEKAREDLEKARENEKALEKKVLEKNEAREMKGL